MRVAVIVVCLTAAGLCVGIVLWRGLNRIRFQVIIGHLLQIQWPLFQRYQVHLSALLSEVPLRYPLTVVSFMGLQLAAAGIGVLWSAIALPHRIAITAPFCLMGGPWAVYGWLIQSQKKFHLSLLKELPGCLDVISIILESGLDLGTGIHHYVEKGPDGPVKNLLRLTESDIRFGLSRVEAFNRLAHRTTFVPLREVCRGTAHALTLGTRLGPLLSRQAAHLRTQRLNLAEKKAAEAPLKIMFPLFVFIFPTIFMVLLGPIVLMFSKGTL
jgi:tight adherence protein C